MELVMNVIILLAAGLGGLLCAMIVEWVVNS